MMSDTLRKQVRFDAKGLQDLVKSNEQCNNKNHRIQVQPPSKITQENKTNNIAQQKKNYSQNSKSSTKPLLDCLVPEPLLTSKPYENSKPQRRRKNRQHNHKTDSFSDDDDAIEHSNALPEKIDVDLSIVDIRIPTAEHLLALKEGFQKILTDRCLSSQSLKQREAILNKLHQIIIKSQPNCQINLYGSIYFECCLEKPGTMDIDVQFKQTSQYDSLKEILDIIKKSDLCKEFQIDTDHKPSCINLITHEPNIRVKITSGYNRGLYLSKLLRLYIKFDKRVVQLLRLFRILSKTCNIDKPEIGTLHPVVFHIMVIHFLQQLDQPVVPCLHEYAYGIDNVPITLNESQYPEFFSVCEKYSREWKSKNTTTVEMLFLQLLSYYVKTFCAKQFVVSIQTRMPVMKLDKNWRSRKLLVEDPTDIKRSLCQTMQSVRSIDYFRSTLNAALNYFGRKQKKRKPKTNSKDCSMENTDDDLIEISPENNNEVSKNEPSKSLHNSYKLFYKNLPPSVVRDINIKQGRVREYYRHTFDNEKNLLSTGIIRMKTSNSKFDDTLDRDIQEAFQHDLENDFETMDENDDDENENHAHLLQRKISNEDDLEQLLNDSLQETTIDQQQEVQDECQTSDTTQQSIDDDSIATMSNTHEENINEGNAENLHEDLQQILSINKTVADLPSSEECETKSLNSLQINIELHTSSYDNQTGNSQIASSFITPTEIEDIISSEQSTMQTNHHTDNFNELYYDFRPENFHAEQGAPYVCTTCNGVGHLKAECPELFIPNMIDMPSIDENWIHILTELCTQITDRLKPKAQDKENRQKILNQLEKQFQKDYPDSNLHAFGSFYNGFGFRQSDLDVCIVFKDEREQNNDEIIRIMQRVLRTVRSLNIFDEVQPVLQAKVPIIRTRHRQLKIDIDISLHNMLAIENTRLLKTYSEIDARVTQLGYMIKHLAKLCFIGDASRGTLSSYAYIIMLIHFLQQIQPPVLPVLQQLADSTKVSMFKKCAKWNVYFFDDLSRLKEIWKSENKLSTGALWIEFLRFYTEQFNYEEYVVTIRQIEPLLKHEKGWFRQTIAIEDPFELSHNLAGGLSPRNWIIIRRVFIRSRQQFCIKPENIDILNPDMSYIEKNLFNVGDLCPMNAPKLCEWCKGPYHIRKRCPKLASLANETEKKKRVINRVEQPTPNNNRMAFVSNNFQDNAYSNYYRYGYNPSKSTSSDQYSSRYVANEKSREFHNSSFQSFEQTMRYPNRSNEHRKKCFKCGSTDHLKAQCPSSQDTRAYQQKRNS